MNRSLVLTGACLLGTIASTSAQSAPPPAGWYFVRQLHERWLASGQRNANAPFVDAEASMKIDSVIGPPTARTSFFTPSNWVHAQFTTNADGVPHAVIGVAGSPPNMRDSAGLVRFNRLDGGRNRVDLPEARVWDLAAPFHPNRLAPGGRWIDTLTLDVAIEGFRQALHGIRVSTLLRDTTIDGHALWIVRDSASVQYIERWPTNDRIGDTPLPVERDVSGILRGTELYDPALRLFHERDDTAHLVGTESIFYPDRRVFHTPVTYDRSRHYALEDSTAHAARLKSARTSRPPVNADSLRKLAADRTQAFARRMAEGDTAAAISALANEGTGMSKQLDLPKLLLMLPVLNDPGRALSMRVNLEYLFRDIAGGLTYRPPAITADTAQWPCAPDACRMLADQWTQAHEPRLRDVGLIAHFVLEPVTWNDTLRARASHDTTLFASALMLSHGIGNTWIAGSRAPMPAAGTPWPRWVDWMSGRNPAYPQVALPGRDTTPSRLAVGFGDTHVKAVQFQQLMSGRNIIGEWQQQLAAATDDSARLVFRTMLIGMNAYHGDPADIAGRLRNGSAVERASAIKEVVALFGKDAPLADSATTVDIQQRFLAIALDHAPFWQPLPPGPRSGAVRSFMEADRPGDSLFILARDLAPAVRAQWSSRARMVMEPAWRAADSFKVSFYTPSAVQQVGPFARMTLDYGFDSPGSGHLAPRPGVFFGSTTVYLMLTENGWVVVTESGWLT